MQEQNSKDGEELRKFKKHLSIEIINSSEDEKR
jgi:hypothetical protein